MWLGQLVLSGEEDKIQGKKPLKDWACTRYLGDSMYVQALRTITTELRHTKSFSKSGNQFSIHVSN